MKKITQMIYTIALALFALFPLATKAQITIYPDYESYTDTSSSVKKYKTIRPAAFAKKYILTDLDGEKSKIKKDSIWGYSSENSGLNRFWNGKIMQLDTFVTCLEGLISSLFIYVNIQDESIMLEEVMIPDTKKVFYFSANLNSEIYPLHVATLSKVFKLTDSQLSKITLLEKEKKINKKNPANNIYYLIETLFP